MEMDKLIQHLRFCGDLEANCHECERYYEMGADGGTASCVNDLMQKAADALAEQQKRIAELEAQNRWIPVTERLPEVGRSVIAYNAPAKCAAEAVYKGGGKFFQFRWAARLQEQEVTHWMPLPELPKEDTQ